MNKVYYKSDTGFICGRYPSDLKEEDGDPFIEVSDEDYAKTFSSESPNQWAVVDGALVEKPYDAIVNSDSYKEMVANNEKCEYQNYLSSTDYVITKLQEISLTGTAQEFADAKEKYADVIAKRKEAREKLAELEG